MPHIDYESLGTFDALLDLSDAAARATMIRLRDALQRLAPDLAERLVMDGLHKKPALAFYRGDDVLLHVFPEPNVSLGLHVSMPIRAHERPLLRTDGLSDWAREALARARPRQNVMWLETTLHRPGRVDELLDLVARRLELLPRVH
jgi:hypothetical protein